MTAKKTPSAKTAAAAAIAAASASSKSAAVPPTQRIIVPPFKFHSAQKTVLAEALRFNVLGCGRRWGKTILGQEVAVFEKDGAIDGFPIGWFAPTYRILTDAFRQIDASTRSIQTASIKDEVIELVTGGRIEFWHLSDEIVARGRKYRKVVIDEAAHVRNMEGVWNRSILATLADYRGDAWFISSPSGMNYFHELFQRGNPKSATYDTLWRSWTMPTASNPHISEEEIEMYRRGMPERDFAQEFLGFFNPSGGGVFRLVSRAITTEPYPFEVDPGDGTGYVIGVDWARHRDYTVFTLLDAKRKRVALVDRFSNIEYEIQRDRLKALHKRFPRASIVAELNSIGEPNVEALRRDGLEVWGFNTTAVSKANIILALAVAFEQGEITIPPDENLVGELMSFDQERLPGGGIRYGAPKGKHDDCVMSLALAWHGLAFGGETADYSRVQGMRSNRERAT